MRPLVIVSRTMFGPAASGAVRRAYLEQFGDANALAPALDLAMRMASVQRFYAFSRLNSPELLAEFADNIRPLLQRLADPIDDLDTP